MTYTIFGQADKQRIEVDETRLLPCVDETGLPITNGEWVRWDWTDITTMQEAGLRRRYLRVRAREDRPVTR